MVFIWVVADDTLVRAKDADKELPMQILRQVPNRWHAVTADRLQPYMSFSYMELAFRYNMQCFNTAIKPAAFKYAFDKHNCRKVLYFDNDIWILQPLTTIIEALDQYRLVVTPHVTQEVPLDGLHQDERTLMLAGQFNFGFIAASKSELTLEFLDWWLNRLRYYGYAEPRKGMHFDQNWGQLMVSYLPQTEYLVLRDPRYNVAYWNLHYRGIHLHMENGVVLYDSEPVVFMHFSGMSDLHKYNLESISPHQNRFKMVDFPELREIVTSYQAMLQKEDAWRWRNVSYNFEYFDDGTSIPMVIRQYYADMMDPEEPFRNDKNLFKELVAHESPFAVHADSGKFSLLDWMLQGAHHLLVEQSGQYLICELVWQVYLHRPDSCLAIGACRY
ncbi:yfnF [Symbiodinium natans]|uniref:YfnF protein n=1 Tax=Symbiodinium natans TaxID=878477 RepID=A0A812PZ16_9DINO|nr:yfnF [Symbiodinium natans]